MEDNFPQSKGALLTADPVALAYLMTETLFAFEQRTQPVELEEKVVDQTKPFTGNKPDYSFIGGNQSGLLFIVNSPGQFGLPEAEMDAFQKILTALKLDLKDIALFNLAQPTTGTVTQPDLGLPSLRQFFRPKKIVVLDSVLVFPESDFIRLHEVSTILETPFLQTYSFTEMMPDLDKKRLCWGALKSLLN